MRKLLFLGLLVLLVPAVGCRSYRYLGIPDSQSYPGTRYVPDRDVAAEGYYRITEVMTVDFDEYARMKRSGITKFEEPREGLIYFATETKVRAPGRKGEAEWVRILERRKAPASPDAADSLQREAAPIR